MLRKSLSILVLLMILRPVAFAQEITDSALIRERNDRYFRLLDLKNTGDMQQKALLEQVLQQADELLKSDNRLIDSLITRNAVVDSLALKMDISESELDSLKTANKGFESYVVYGMYGAAGAGLIIITLIVLVVVFSSAKTKLRKKIKGTQDLEKENENLKLEVSSVEKMMQQNADMIGKLNRTLEMKDSRLKDMQQVIDGADNKFNEKCAEYDSIILELRNNETQLISDKIKANTKASETVSQLETRVHELEAALNNSTQAGSTENGDIDNIRAGYEERISALEGQLDEMSRTRDSLIQDFEQKLSETKSSESRLQMNHEQAEQELMRQLSEAQAKVSEYESILNDPEKRAFRDQEFNKKLSEMELRVIKLGKVDRMYKDGLVTSEEYSLIKQKILEDF